MRCITFTQGSSSAEQRSRPPTDLPIPFRHLAGLDDGAPLGLRATFHSQWRIGIIQPPDAENHMSCGKGALMGIIPTGSSDPVNTASLHSPSLPTFNYTRVSLSAVVRRLREMAIKVISAIVVAVQTFEKSSP